MNSLLDYKFDIQLTNWTPIASVYHSLFTDDEISRLREASHHYNDSARTVVFLSFENRLATGGGLGAVVKLLPDKIRESGERIILLSPFFKNIKSMSTALESGEVSKIDELNISIDQKSCLCSIYKDNASSVESYYVNLNDYFNQSPTPYDYENGLKLIEDSFAFSEAVPAVLSKLNRRDNLLIHANDWETAPTVITIKNALIKGFLHSAKVVLTLHNSYDAEMKNGEDIRFTGKKSRAATVLQYSIPFLDAPLSTVSWPFALELTQDNLQREYFTSHLQYLFSMNPPVGINNGQFLKTDGVKVENVSEIKKLKKKYNSALWNILKEYTDKRIIGNVKISKSDSAKPILFMSGRMDLMQKGFDVIFHAFKRIKRDSAVLVFSPSITNEREMNSLGFFEDIAKELDGEIAIWPFRIPRDQYDSFLKGSSYFIMPSLYEPFGAANEAYLNSTPVIARATGGLWAQVNPLKDCDLPFYLKASREMNTSDKKSTGFLYREKYSGNVDDWRSIMSLPCENRIDNPLYNSMVDEAANAINSAIEIYKKEDEYFNLILNGSSKVMDFDWRLSVNKYKALYNCVQRSAL